MGSHAIAVPFPTLAPSRPTLEWIVTRPGKVNAISRVDVLGHIAFARAGLVAWAAPSREVRLFVFLPHGRKLADGWPQGAAAWRYESWLVTDDGLPFGPKRLVRHIVPGRECLTADFVDVFAAAEQATRSQLLAWLGKLG